MTMREANGTSSRLWRDRVFGAANRPHSDATSRLWRDPPACARFAVGVLAGRAAAFLADSPEPGSCAPVFLPSRDFVSE